MSAARSFNTCLISLLSKQEFDLQDTKPDLVIISDNTEVISAGFKEKDTWNSSSQIITRTKFSFDEQCYAIRDNVVENFGDEIIFDIKLKKYI
ncbi:hypothetical protein RO3G_11545 [Rhizopus delemar RA 99-880]|uniref:Uncharacterized protein n=1 Tax=Rhizopus delemar (strain RA 99-880 / ATCC MYA-4621 / FGSC 9543 / NRRL 43880) TaxID=246409 RepID=I1CEF4_RHIO9|nr:hypothetical protein RO3G_11545 [Rhizopus delemar RA 99-880]|eukprot:EIE86834.1 hypothetical protein RO3G_11545 [Rhizopus delemar RA 99-880]